MSGTVSVVTAYFLAAAKYPHIQEQAQAEMDRVSPQAPDVQRQGGTPLPQHIVQRPLQMTAHRPARTRIHDPQGRLRHAEYLIRCIGGFWFSFTFSVGPVGNSSTTHRSTTTPSSSTPRDSWDQIQNRTQQIWASSITVGGALHPSTLTLLVLGSYFNGQGIHLADVSLWICVAKAVAGLTVSRALDEHGNIIDRSRT
ncbi:hypothetical protein FB451DRAFT_1401132 [Mycena latifolia]|nr:hypothetical protein FB451DRAFT_1401132 [Mycena latifolia]